MNTKKNYNYTFKYVKNNIGGNKWVNIFVFSVKNTLNKVLQKSV